VSIVLDTPEKIEAYRCLALYSALKLEVRTGMKMSRGISTLKILREQYGITARTKQDALDVWRETLIDAGILREGEGLAS
jgi:hypothetical protein